MNKTIATLTAILVLAITLQTGQAQITADDFMPVVEGGSSEIADPAKVEVKDDLVTAPTAQDAINAAVEENEKELAKGDTAEVGCKMVKFGSGMGFVASGMSSYRNMENPVATRISKRKAYVVAFASAKKNLAEHLSGLTTEGQTEVHEALVSTTLSADEMSNISQKTVQSYKQAVDMMLRGFVIYEVNDDVEKSMVTVSIATTPKTRGMLARPAPAAVEVETLRDGINQVLQEVKAGVVPPVGGRIIMVRSTGETAFVGFGSGVVRSSKNAAAQAKLKLNSQKIARARASDALCGVIIGDRSSWQSTMVDETVEGTQEFEEINKAVEGDPLGKENVTETRKLDKAYDTFVSTLRTEEVFKSARSGVLPPGVTPRTWFDEDENWVYGMAVYIPSQTNAAAATAEEMKNSSIIQGINGAKPGQGKASNSAAVDPKVVKPGAGVKRGPSGKVSDDNDN